MVYITGYHAMIISFTQGNSIIKTVSLTRPTQNYDLSANYYFLSQIYIAHSNENKITVRTGSSLLALEIVFYEPQAPLKISTFL